MLGLVHTENLVLNRVPAGTHGFERVSRHQYGQQIRRRIERHENDDRVGNALAGAFHEAGKRLTNGGHETNQIEFSGEYSQHSGLIWASVTPTEGAARDKPALEKLQEDMRPAIGRLMPFADEATEDPERAIAYETSPSEYGCLLYSLLGGS